MIFDIHYSNQSRKFLKKTERILLKRLIEKIEKLKEEPIIADSKKIEGAKGLFRVRVGDYRILYEVDYENREIGIVGIDKREDAYLRK